jgi:ketosteroid isomerase-like protein
MYHAIVRRKLRHVFSSLSQGNFEPGLAGLASRFDHVFSGTHALGGTRHTKAGMRRWFERLFLLFPKLDFTIKHIAVCGPPWNTYAMVEWQDLSAAAVQILRRGMRLPTYVSGNEMSPPHITRPKPQPTPSITS